MTPIVYYLLYGSIIFYGIIVAGEFLLHRSLKSSLLEAVTLIVFAIFLYFVIGFPDSRIAFGGVPPILAIAVMFIAVLLGMGAQFAYLHKGPFAWRPFLKPAVVSPIVLLPLIGSIQQNSPTETIQLVSLGIIAFQNGFFWKTVLDHAAPST